MTQIIAALCNNRDEIVLVSDRMVSASDDSLQFEYEPKIQMITEYAACLISGTMHEPEVIEDARLEIAGRQNTLGYLTYPAGKSGGAGVGQVKLT